MVNKIYKKYLPFYSKSFSSVSSKAAVDINKIFLPYRVIDEMDYLSSYIPDVDTDKFRQELSRFIMDIPGTIQFHKIDPLGIYIPDNFNLYQLSFLRKIINKIEYIYNDEDLKNLFKVSKIGDSFYIDGSVTIFYYNSVLSLLTVYEYNDVFDRAVYLGDSSLEDNFVTSRKFIDLAKEFENVDDINSYYADNLEQDDKVYIEYLKDQKDIQGISDDFDFEKAKKSKKNKKQVSSTTIYKRVKSFVSSDQKGMKSVPCLCGLSGIAKSSIVKDIADDMGYRFVDFRAAFLHRLDMEGMFYTMDEKGQAVSYDSYEEVERYSTQAPLGEFVKTSDQYMDYAKSMAEKLKEVKKIDNGATEEKEEKVLKEGEEKVGDFILAENDKILNYNNREEYAKIEEGDSKLVIKYNDSGEEVVFKNYTKLKEVLLDRSSSINDSLVELDKEVNSLFDNEIYLERLFDKAKEYEKYLDFWNVTKEEINEQVKDLENRVANSSDQVAESLKKQLSIYKGLLEPVISDKPGFSNPDEIKLKKQKGGHAYDIQGNRYFAKSTDQRGIYDVYLNEKYLDETVEKTKGFKQFIYNHVNKLYKNSTTNHELVIDLALKSGDIVKAVDNDKIDATRASDLLQDAGEEVPDKIKKQVKKTTGVSTKHQENTEKISKDLKEDEQEDSAGVDTDHQYYHIYRELKNKNLFKYIDTLIEQYEEAATPAFLFFDEIVRADDKILNLFTQLLDEKEFNNMTFYRSKMVAAANTPHGITEADMDIDAFKDLSNLFVQSENDSDPAVLNRLSVIPVTIDNVYDSFVEHMDKAKFHSYIQEFITKDGKKQGKNRAYNITSLLKKTGGDVRQARQSTYPTFRGWERVSNMLKAKDNQDNPVFEQSVRGMLGDLDVTDEFISWLKSEKGFEFDTKSKSGVDANVDPQSAMLESNMESGVATGLFGPSGIGKTSRINNLVESKYGWQKMKFQMSQKSPNDLMGQPSIINMNDYVVGDLKKKFGDNFGVFDEISDDAMEEVNEGSSYKLPTKVTMRSPQKDVQDAFDEIRRVRDEVNKDAKLVLIFDECLDYESRILCEGGVSKRIGEIVNKDIDVNVLSYNHDKGIVEYKPIISKFKNSDKKTYNYVFESIDGQRLVLKAADNHRIYVNGEYKEIGKLNVGESVSILSKYDNENLTPNNFEGYLLEVNERKSNGQAATYNIEVEGNHNYFADGMLVKNCNRYPEGSESVQSAIFEAISDDKFCGIDFDPDEVAVVCSANINYADEDEFKDADENDLERAYGEKSNYGAANELGSALRLRMSSYDKKDIDESDAKAVRSFMTNEKNDYNKIIRDYISQISDNELVKMLKSAEYKSLFDNVPAPRNLDTLSVFLDSNPDMFEGAWFFPSAGDLDNAQTLGTFGGQDVLSSIKENLDKPYVQDHWVALGSDIETGIDGMDTPKDVIEAVKYVVNNMGDNGEVDQFAEKLHSLVIDIEFDLRGERKTMLQDYLGSEQLMQKAGLDVLNGIMDRNNLVQSGEVIDYRAVKDRDTADMWFSFVIKQDYKIDNVITDYIDEAFDYFIEINHFEYIIFVILSAIKRLDETRIKTFLEKLLNQRREFDAKDDFFAKYNKEIVDAIRNTTYNSLGAKFDQLAKNIK